MSITDIYICLCIKWHITDVVMLLICSIIHTGTHMNVVLLITHNVSVHLMHVHTNILYCHSCDRTRERWMYSEGIPTTRFYLCHSYVIGC